MPQGFANLAPVGSLLKRPREVGSRKRTHFGRSPRMLDVGHLEAVRLLPCLRCGMDPCSEAAHVRASSAAHGKRNAMGRKPDDTNALPICRGCHQDDPDSLHKIGELSFFADLDIDPLLTCERLYAVSPDVERMRAVVMWLIKERSR